MEACLNSKKNVIMRWIALASFLCMGTLLIVLTHCLINSQPDDFFSLSMCLLLYFTGVAVSVFGVLLFIEQSRRYSVDSSGITINYFGTLSSRILWKDVESIAVCDVNHAAKDHTVFDIVIRIAIGVEKYGPFSEIKAFSLNGQERWRSGEYGLFHFKRVILIDYSAERLAQIQEASQMIVHYHLTNQARSYMVEYGDELSP